MKPTPPPEDLEQATVHAATFRAAVKAGRGQRWVDQGPPTSLTEVCEVVSTLDAFEIGIFLVHPDGSGTVYWTSRWPDVYNSTVIAQVRL